MSKFADWFTGRWLKPKEGDPIRAGGQAVMEGVMMRGPKYTAVAVRTPSGRIVAKRKENLKLSDKYPFFAWPIIRGVVNFVIMLWQGTKTLMDSAEMAGEEAEEPSAFEKKAAQILHIKPEDVMLAAAVILALVLAIGLFFMLPTAIESLLKRLIESKVVVNILGGIVRIGVFLLYVFLVSKQKDIHRVFMYHGAEHKSVFCLENGMPLTVENARTFSRLHPRCGTSFLVIVMVISIFIFTLLGSDSGNVFARIGSRLLLLPVVAGISYDVLQWLGRAKDNKCVRTLKWPGLMVQRITTAEPDDSMLEVALASLKYALDMPDAIPVYDDEPRSAEDAGPAAEENAE